MKKRIILMVFAVVLSAFFSLGYSFCVQAYTEEEKAQAKAWLSAHGYSPDAGGASQAYQDYLDGKFDDELGIDSSDGTTEDGSAAAEDEKKNKDVARPIGGKEGSERVKKKTDNSSQEASTASGDGNTGIDGEQVTPAGGKEKESPADASSGEEAFSESNRTEEKTEAVDVAAHAAEKKGSDEEKRTEEVTLYQEQKADDYRQAATVIFFSVMVVAVIAGIAVLFR